MKKLIVLSFILSILSAQVTNNSMAIKSINDYSDMSNMQDYSVENIENFKNYVINQGYDLYDIKSVYKLSENFDDLYNQALEDKVIVPLENDILLLDKPNSTITPLWNAGKTIDSENNGTHQVITRDALSVVSPLFPDFFAKNYNNVFVAQSYSDYPDIKETDYFNSWHFYNYNNKHNYFNNILDGETAKSKFLEHYENAKNYYNINVTKSFRELGAAIHYLTDIGTPVHTGDGITSAAEAEWFIQITAIISIPLYISLYMADMVNRHVAFEDYVESIDQISEMAIPNNVDLEYYRVVSLHTLIEDLSANSFSYYDEARSDSDNNKFIATANTLPYIKEVVAGLLYRFAYEMNGMRQVNFDGVLIRNKASNLYLTAASNQFENGSNVYLDKFKATSTQLFMFDEWVTVDSTDGSNIISPKNYSNKALDVNGNSSADYADVQMYDENQSSAQFFRSFQQGDTGYYKILTGSSGNNKVIGTTGTNVGSEIYQLPLNQDNKNHWYLDLYKSLSFNWKTNNSQGIYIQKGQYIYYKLNFTSSGFYSIETYSNDDIDTYLELYDSNFNAVGSFIDYDDAGNRLHAKIFRQFSAGTYYVKVRMYSANTEGRISLSVISTNNDTPLPVYSPTVLVSNIESAKINLFKISFSTPGNYRFYTTGYIDTYITLYNSNMVKLDEDDDDGEGTNASYSYNIKTNEVIYIALRGYSSSTNGTTSFHVD